MAAGRLHPRDGRCAGAGGSRRAHARRQRRHSARRRAGDPRADGRRSCNRSPTCRCRSIRRSSPRSPRGSRCYKGKALVNSVTGEEDRLEAVLPLVKKYGAAVVAISNDETGISQDPDVRFAVAKKIVERAADHGIPASDIVIDPLVMPIGAIRLAGVQVMQLVHRLRTRVEGQHDVRRVQRELRPAAARRHQHGVPDDGDRVRAHLGDHQSAARGHRQGVHGRRRDDGPRSRLHAVDPQVPRDAGGWAPTAKPGAAGAKSDSDEERDAACRDRRHAATRARSSSSRRRAGAVACRSARRSCRRARSLGVDIDSGLRRARPVRPLPGRCWPKGISRSTA